MMQIPRQMLQTDRHPQKTVTNEHRHKTVHVTDTQTVTGSDNTRGLLALMFP